VFTPALESRLAEIQSRSRLNQNVIIDAKGLRIGRKVWIPRENLPPAIQRSSLSFCIALRGNACLKTLLQQLNDDQELLSGRKTEATYAGIKVTTKFSRVLLVVPDYQRVKKFVSPPLGLERIAAFLRHANDAIDVEIIDPNLTGEVADEEAQGKNDPRLARNKLLEYVKGQHYDLVGFSSLTATLRNDALTIMLLSSAWEEGEKPVFVMGNYGVLLGAEALFGALPPLDALVWGPGEYPLAAMVEALQHLRRSTSPGETLRAAEVFNMLSGADFSPALMAVRGKDSHLFPRGKTFLPTPPESLTELNSLIDQYAIPYEEYWATYRDKPRNLRFHISGTSCPYECTFCCLTKGKLTFMPVEAVVEMFRHARRAYPEIRAFSFTDDNLFIDRKYLLALAEGIRRDPEWREALTFYCQCRADSVRERDAALLTSVGQTGFHTIAIGVESFSDRTLAELNKRATAAQARFTIAALAEHGFAPTANLILFPPDTTLKDLAITFRHSLEICKDPNLHIDPNFLLSAYPAAPLTEKVEALQQGRPYQGKARAALEAPWIQAVEIVYDTVEGLKLPHHFKVLRERMGQLCTAATALSKQAIRLTNTDANNLGRKGLMIIWSILSVALENAMLFDDASAGEGSAAAIEEFRQIKREFEAVIRIRYQEEAEAILGALAGLEIPRLS
jgi:radical SAM superfamily enzyme YgiQ (UPF0313 family)